MAFFDLIMPVTTVYTPFALNTATAAATADGAVDAIAQASVLVEPTGFGLVLDQIEHFILLPMVYLSILFMVAGIIYRMASIMRSPATPFSLKIYPSKSQNAGNAWSDTFLMPQIRRRKPVFWISLMLFHIAGLLLILGHLDILPSINIMPAESNHMIGAGLVGLFFTLPLFHFLFRRFRTPIREITVPADYLLLILVIFLALFGDLISWGNSWTTSGFILKKADFSVYFQHLASFNFENPRYFLGGPHYHFVVIHVLLANLFFILVPFSKIVHAFFAMPINLLRRK